MHPELEPVAPISPPAPYLGGKRSLASVITARIASVPHSIYVEPFVGMGGIFFRRAKRPKAEVINDRNGEVANLFRILQRHYAPFMDHLKYQLTSRREFERLAKTNPATLTDLERAARFLYLQRVAYGGKVVGQNFGVSPDRPARFDVLAMASVLEEIFERLSSVTIENLDWSAVIDRYDRDGALFYLDPPYWNNEDDYGTDMFGREQFALIAEKLRTMKGRAIVSINDLPEVRSVFAGLPSESVGLNYSIGQATRGPKAAGELIIWNEA